jgi:hypothetical protein
MLYYRSLSGAEVRVTLANSSLHLFDRLLLLSTSVPSYVNSAIESIELDGLRYPVVIARPEVFAANQTYLETYGY